MYDTAKLSQLYWDVCFLAFFSIALWESFRPRRKATRATVRRWTQQGALAAMTNVVGVLFRTSPLAVAAAVSASPYGLLNHPAVPFALRFVAAVLILDFTRYAQHRLLHSIPLLWRVHQVHHSDEHFDLTTGVRFHPAEAALTHAWYLAVVAIVAPPFEAVLVVEFATLVQNFFSHANLRIPDRSERYLRRVLITPEMHRVHHSVRVEEQNTNFGSILPWWDRALGTYLAAPAAGHDGLRFGLKELETGPELTLIRLLTMPFISARKRSNVIDSQPTDSAANSPAVSSSTRPAMQVLPDMISAQQVGAGKRL